MKKCHNCTYLWPDDYGGTCEGCGANLSTSQGQTQMSPDQALRRQAMLAQQDAQRERQIGARDHANLRFDSADPIVAMAREFVIDKRTPEQRARDEQFGL
jgi:hypothetical protein